MTSPVPRPTRMWQDIAEEASHEHDTQKLIELAKELERALDERDKRSPQPLRIIPDQIQH